MRTWFDKDTQQWVSSLPRAYWLGILDYYTNEKLYSDDKLYYKGYDNKWYDISCRCRDARVFYRNYHMYPSGLSTYYVYTKQKNKIYN